MARRVAEIRIALAGYRFSELLAADLELPGQELGREKAQGLDGNSLGAPAGSASLGRGTNRDQIESRSAVVGGGSSDAMKSILALIRTGMLVDWKAM
jgi:hypothetical protein